MSIRLVARALVWLLLCSTCVNAGAWSARGHSQIAEHAISGLIAEQQQALAALAALGPWANKPAAPRPAHLTQAAVWPDRVRDVTP